MNKPQSFEFSTKEEYAIAMIIFNGSDHVLYPPNRYLWDILPTIYIDRHRLIIMAAHESGSLSCGIDMTKYNLDSVLV